MQEQQPVTPSNASMFLDTIALCSSVRDHLIELVSTYKPDSPWLSSKTIWMTEYNMIGAPASHGGCAALGKHMNAVWHASMLSEVDNEL